ncbi:MAG: class I SAM-dependent methyltransferase [Alphaproteobacteria bacterium]
MNEPHLIPRDASSWVVRFAPFVRAGGPVLDLACGGGRHARLFLGLGHPVTALDRDTAALGGLPRAALLEVVQADLEDGSPWPLAGRRFAGIVVANYLHRPLFPAILAALEPGGILIYETFAAGNERFGRPRNPDHLLKSGELLDIVRDRLEVIAYEYLEVAEPRPAVVQRIAARAGGHMSLLD